MTERSSAAGQVASPAPDPSFAHIDGATIERLTPMPELIAALEAAFRTGGASPVRHAHALPAGASLLIMPAWREGGAAGVKIVTVQPAARPSIQSTYLLLDGHSGRLAAVLDATMLTPRRTAAASALACARLARADARRLLIVGSGVLVRHLVEAHAAVRAIDEVLLWARDAGKAAAAVADLRARGYPARMAERPDAAIVAADIISTATLSDSPLIRGDLLRPGTHLDLVGAFRPDMAEADPACFRRARVYVDSRAAALEEAGDLIQAIAAGAIAADEIVGDLADLCADRVAGRRNEAEITLFKSVGLGIEDLAAAELVYRKLRAIRP